MFSKLKSRGDFFNPGFQGRLGGGPIEQAIPGGYPRGRLLIQFLERMLGGRLGDSAPIVCVWGDFFPLRISGRLCTRWQEIHIPSFLPKDGAKATTGAIY